MLKNVELGDVFRLLGDTKLWIVVLSGNETFNLIQLNKYGCIGSDQISWFKDSVSDSELFRVLSEEGFIHIGNVYIDDSFVKNYL